MQVFLYVGISFDSAVEIPEFSGNSYLKLGTSTSSLSHSFTIEMTFTPKRSTGLLIYSGGASTDYFSLALVDSIVVYR